MKKLIVRWGVFTISVTSLVPIFSSSSYAATPTPNVVGCSPGELVVITSNTSHQNLIYQTFFQGPSTGTANELNNNTLNFSVTATAGAQANFIFASLNGQISGGISQSTSAQYGSTVKVNVSAGKTTYVGYVARYDAITGYTTNVDSTCHFSPDVSFSAKAPTVDGWIQSSSPVTSN